MVEPSAARSRVLSLQLPAVGHLTYGKMLRRVFERSTQVELVPFWTDEHREVHARIVNRLLYQRSPFGWMRERNLDFSRERREVGYAYYGRRLLDRYVARVAPAALHFHTQTLALLCADYVRAYPTIISTDQSGVQAGAELPVGARWTHGGNVLLERASLRAAAAIVVWSQWNADSMIASHGIEAEKVHVIPPGIDTSFFTEKTQRGEMQPLRLLFVGANWQRKGGSLLVDTFVERFADRDVELHVVTTEPDVRPHRSVIVHRNVSAYSAEWKRLYEEADVFVLPTHYDAFGIAYIEAMAAGLPVIGTGTNAGPEIILDGQTGFLIAPGDARALADRIGRLLDDAALRRTLGTRGRARAILRFDEARNGTRLEALFRSVAQGGKGVQRAGRKERSRSSRECDAMPLNSRGLHEGILLSNRSRA